MQADKTVAEIQQEFSSNYPFLKVEFFRKEPPANTLRKQLYHLSLKRAAAGNFKSGELEISDIMTVRELEEQFYTRFGLAVQVFRKSGKLWLETTMTDNWTLKQQNDHGEEIAIAFRTKDERTSIDFDLNRDAD
ncbi:MAG: hypothetical protein QM731_23945 [Chitinophagaceae bacterium]